MQYDDKSVVPASLQYRDRGFMYFPDQALIPFIKAADNKIKKFANSDGIREHGRNIARVATEQARMDESLNSLHAVSLNIGLRATISLRGKPNNRLEGHARSTETLYTGKAPQNPRSPLTTPSPKRYELFIAIPRSGGAYTAAYY